MQADYIESVIVKIDELPYKCILFDGDWGIGKTYAINKALKNQENVCRISMFGMQNSQQIYHEALFQLALGNSLGGKIGEIASNIIEGISAVWEKAAQAKDVICNIAKERELFFLLSKEFDKHHIIVIDDIERISDNIQFEEVLGIIEELKQCSFVKVVLVANMKEISEPNYKLFEKYNEKVVDRVYHITERPEKINWGDLGIHGEFMTEFLREHKVKNLRTLQKAQKFFDDVKLYCEEIDNQQFINEVRLICFAIVVESTDNLYYEESTDEEMDKTKRAMLSIHNILEHRVMSYLRKIKSSRNLVTLLLAYYSNEISLSSDEIATEYFLFLEAGNKPNFYKTDEEMKRTLPGLAEKIREAVNISSLIKLADEYEVWSGILEVENQSVLKEFEDKLREMLLNEVMQGNEACLNYGYSMWNISSEEIKRIYKEECEFVRKKIIENYVGYLKENPKGELAYEYSYKLREYCENSFFREIISNAVEPLYCEKSFPIDDMNDTRYHTSYNLMYVLYNVDSEKFEACCEMVKRTCDNMARHRIDIWIKEIKEK